MGKIYLTCLLVILNVSVIVFYGVSVFYFKIY
jgi:hypothetical protein